MNAVLVVLSGAALLAAALLGIERCGALLSRPSNGLPGALPAMSDTERGLWRPAPCGGRQDSAAARIGASCWTITSVLSAANAFSTTRPNGRAAWSMTGHNYPRAFRSPPQVYGTIRNKGFLGLIIPKEYGGLGFCAHAHSASSAAVDALVGAGGVGRTEAAHEKRPFLHR